MRACLAILFCIAFTGCAQTIESAKQAQSTARSCCTTIAQLPYEDLEPNNHQITFDITTNSPYFNFESGGSYFKAFSLKPSLKSNKKLSLKSYIQTLGFGRKNYFFQPALLLLDNNYQIIANSTSISELIRNDLFSSGDVVLNKSVDLPANVKYLIIYTTPQLMEAKTLYQFNQSTYASGVVLSNDGIADFPSGPVGKLSIKLQ